MIEADAFLERLRGAGFGLVSGVPCSYLTPLINAAIDSTALRYVNAANEGDAVAVAAGAELGGRRAVVMFQNSGLGNAVNPLTSLAIPYAIPMLLIVTWRGQPGGPRDEPQHELMGAITPRLLELMGIPWEPFPATEETIEEPLDRALQHFEAVGTPYAFVLPHGTVAKRRLQAAPRQPAARTRCIAGVANSSPHDPDQVLRAVQSAAGPGDLIVSTTGYTSRALYALGDRDNQFYVVGSMGCASCVALGLALARPERRVLLVDGDGAALMRPSAMALLGSEQPANLVHLLLDNGVHDSTGAQATLSSSVDFRKIAEGCRYPSIRSLASLTDLDSALRSGAAGLQFLYLKTVPRSRPDLPRPTITPAGNAERLRTWIRCHDLTQQPATAS